jgi:CheY-like chemotaxis protein
MLRSCVLNVDDDENDRFFLEHAAKQAGLGLPLLFVESGEEAIAYLAGEGHYANRERFPQPCIILLDVMMNGLDGFEVLRWIRGQPELDATVVIMFSGSRHDNDSQMAARLGANSFVSKPADCEKRLELIKALRHYWLTFHEFGWGSSCRVKGPHLVGSAPSGGPE